MLCILLMLSLIGDKTLFMIAIILTNTLQDAEEHILYQTSDNVYFFVGPTIVITMLMAVWMLYYELTFYIITSPDNKWTHFIDPNYNENHSDFFANNWFIRNLATFGNTKFITKYIMLPSISIIYTTIYLSQYVSSFIHYFLFLLWMIIIVIFITIICCNIPRAKIEIFHIKKSNDRMLSIGVSFALCFTFYVVLKSFVISSKYQLTLILPFQYLFTLQYFLAGNAATKYVLRECNLLTVIAPKGDISIISSSQSPMSYLTLSRILRQKLSFDSFMSHLMTEFSSENLLCILEMLQFKKMIKAINNKRKTMQNISESDENLSIYVGFHDALVLNPALFDICLPESDQMPQSVIVYDAKDRIEQRAQQLIEKYVYSPNRSCIFEVNISSSCKYELIKKAAALDKQIFDLQDLYNLFDTVLVELICLLNDSHARFIRTNEYKQLIAHHIMLDDEEN